MKEFTVLHLSDLHISKYDKKKKIDIIKKIISDCKENISQSIDLVLFTGDMVQSGEIENFNYAKEVIELILNSFSIELDKFIYIPGNHEVNISSIKTYYFSGLANDNDKKAWDNYSFQEDKDLCHQMKEYNCFEGSVSFEHDIVANKIYNINNCKIGVTAINSAWFSTGKTTSDRDRILIPSRKIREYYEKITDCEFKIAILHHPYIYLRDEYVSDVEKELGKYDLVLSGHIHDDSMNIITSIPGNKALFITGNEINDTEKNGYSIYKVSLVNQKISISMRKYYKKRDMFDNNNELLENGNLIYDINSVSNEDKILYEVFMKTKKKYILNLDNLMVTNLLDTKFNNSFNSSFIIPKLTIPDMNNEYETNRINIDFNEIFSPEYDKIILTGKKEVGKTVLANYIASYYYENFIQLKKIPVVINSKNLKLNNSNNIINIIKETINNYTDDDYSVTNSKIKVLIKNNGLLLIVDDFSERDNLLYESINKLNLDKIFFFMEESITTLPYIQTTTIFNNLKENTSILNARIEEFSKNQIRNYSKLLLKGSNYNVDELCRKTVSLFNEMSLPKTPFAVSLFISICSINSDFEPTNKSKIIEKLIEILLEKLSPDDIYLKAYGFDSKCSFLAELAYDMYLKNQYYYTTNEFMEFVVNYHKKKLFPMDETKFDTLFFKKNILINKNNKVMFRFKCFINYFLALHFSKNYDEIIALAKSDKYYNYDELFEYFSGINKNITELAVCISDKFNTLIDEIPNINDILDISFIKTELMEGFTKENVDTYIPLCDEEKDDLTDINIDSDYDPIDIDPSKEKLNTEKLFATMKILGSIIKNSEDFNGEEKIKYLKIFMKGSVCLTRKIFDSFKDMLLNYKEKLLSENISNEKKQKKLENAFDKLTDVVKLTIPLIIQEFILDSVGTRKLKTVIEEIIVNIDEKQTYEFLNYICLYADLRINNWNNYFIEFINENKNYYMQSLIILKCFTYLEMNYFNDDLKKCKNVLYKIYELKGGDKSSAKNFVDSSVKRITIKNNNNK